MAAIVNQNIQGGQAPNIVQGSSNAGSNNSLMRISAGPAALAALLIYQIMALYAQIISMDQAQKVNMVKAQASEAQGQADSTNAAGYNQFVMSMVMGALTIGGAAAGLIYAGVASGTGAGAEANKSINDAEAKLTPMKTVEDVLPKGPEDLDIGNLSDEQKTDIDTRMDEFENHDFSNAKDDDVTKGAIQRLKARDLDEDDEFNLDNWKKEFNDSLTRKSQGYNSAVIKQETVQNTITRMKGFIDTASNSGSNFAQGAGQSAKAKNDANVALQSAASQMSGSASGDFGQAASKAFDAQNAEIQVLQNMHQTNSVNG